ncbi:Serine/threonine-protein kinase 11-interacting protein [Trichoplax sp. H2]|nr:Serine/threonine-protein kinase 11-interacting protein [Trichoplax sp. H2]|eukprot:RDD45356.1 Serine/threonine-protein kinase 11-interacting protein [Trichoplax sp. H2]
MAAAKNDDLGLQFISKFVKLLRAKGEEILSGKAALSLNLASLHYINQRLKDIGFDENHQSLEKDFDIITVKDHLRKKGNEDILVIYDFMQKAIKLKLINHGATLWNSPKINLSRFRSLQSLEIKKIPLSCIAGLKFLRPQLKSLTFTRCVQHLSEVLISCCSDRTVPSLWSKLEVADFGHNSITSVDDSLNFLPMLQTLLLNDNRLLNKNCNFEMIMCNISVLNLGYNNLDKIPVMSYETKKSLKVLILKNNSLDNIEGIKDYKNLEILDLSGNLITSHTILSPLASLHSLCNVNLTENPIAFHKNHRQRVIQFVSSVISHPTTFILDGKQLTSQELKAKITNNFNIKQTSISSERQSIPAVPNGIGTNIINGADNLLAVNSSPTSSVIKPKKKRGKSSKQQASTPTKPSQDETSRFTEKAKKSKISYGKDWLFLAADELALARSQLDSLNLTTESENSTYEEYSFTNDNENVVVENNESNEVHTEDKVIQSSSLVDDGELFLVSRQLPDGTLAYYYLSIGDGCIRIKDTMKNKIIDSLKLRDLVSAVLKPSINTIDTNKTNEMLSNEDENANKEMQFTLDLTFMYPDSLRKDVLSYVIPDRKDAEKLHIQLASIADDNCSELEIERIRECLKCKHVFMVPIRYPHEGKADSIDPPINHSLCPKCGSDKVFFVVKKQSKEVAESPRSDLKNLNSSSTSFQRSHSNSHPEITAGSRESTKSTPASIAKVASSGKASLPKPAARSLDSNRNDTVDGARKFDTECKHGDFVNNQERDNSTVIVSLTTDNSSVGDNQSLLLESTNIESEESDNLHNYGKNSNDIDSISENLNTDHINSYASLRSSNDDGSEYQSKSAVSTERQEPDISGYSDDVGGYHTMDSSELLSATSLNSDNDAITQDVNKNNSKAEDFSILDHNTELVMNLTVYSDDERSEFNLKASCIVYPESTVHPCYLICTNTSIYLLEIGTADDSESNEQTQPIIARNQIENLAYIDVGYNYQSFRMEFKYDPKCFTIIVKDKNKCSSFLDYFCGYWSSTTSLRDYDVSLSHDHISYTCNNIRAQLILKDRNDFNNIHEIGETLRKLALRSSKTDLIGDKKFKKKVFRDCFVANQFLDWLMDVTDSSRLKVLELANELLNAKIISNVSNHDKEIADNGHLYRFEDENVTVSAPDVEENPKDILLYLLVNITINDDCYENVCLVVSLDDMYIARVNFTLPISRVLPKIHLLKARQSQFLIIAKQAITSILEVEIDSKVPHQLILKLCDESEMNEIIWIICAGSDYSKDVIITTLKEPYKKRFGIDLSILIDDESKNT